MHIYAKIAEIATFAASAAPPSTTQRTTWNSPVPYLFGGIAAMLGLIALALVLLACSYLNFSGYLENRFVGERDLEADGGDGGVKAVPRVLEEKYFVIMAGQEKPTFLATPVSSRASSFGSRSSSTGESSSEENCEEKTENCEEIEMGNMETHEAAADPVL